MANYMEQLNQIIESKKLQEIVHLRPNSPLKISSLTIEKLDTLTLSHILTKTNDYYLLGLIYMLILSSEEFEERPLEVITPNLPFSLVNINRKIKGSHLANRLSFYLIFLLDKIDSLQHAHTEHPINDIDLEEIRQEIENVGLDLGDVFNEWDSKHLPMLCELVNTSKLDSLSKYSDLMGLCTSLEEQICIYTEKSSKFLSQLLSLEISPRFSFFLFFSFILFSFFKENNKNYRKKKSFFLVSH
jgi:hypothetical protein